MRQKEEVTRTDIGESIILQHALEDMSHNRGMKVSFCIALYLVLGLIWMPGFTLGTRVFDVAKPEEPSRRVVLRPPPEKPLVETKLQEKRNRSMPLPDRTPEDPEPLIVPDLPAAPEIIASDDWTIGIPVEAPVRTNQPILDGTKGLESPVFIKKVLPQYPERAVKLGMQGYVLVSAILREDGSVGDIEILRGLGNGKFGFEDKAIEAVKKWQFLPGKLRDKPVPVRMNLKIDFVLSR